MKIVFDDIKKYVVEFDDDDIDCDADIKYINKLSKSDKNFQVLDDYTVVVYR